MKRGLLATKKTKITSFDILRRPIVTEKTTMQAESSNKVVFEVMQKANKHDVKSAIESIFSVSVEKVNIINLPGKTKRFRGIEGKRSGLKKAIVTLKAGDSLSFVDGV